MKNFKTVLLGIVAAVFVLFAFQSCNNSSDVPENLGEKASMSIFNNPANPFNLDGQIHNDFLNRANNCINNGTDSLSIRDSLISWVISSSDSLNLSHSIVIKKTLNTAAYICKYWTYQQIYNSSSFSTGQIFYFDSLVAIAVQFDNGSINLSTTLSKIDSLESKLLSDTLSSERRDYVLLNIAIAKYSATFWDDYSGGNMQELAKTLLEADLKGGIGGACAGFLGGLYAGAMVVL